MPYDITTRHVQDQLVVSVRAETTMAGLSSFVGETIGTLISRLQRVGVAPDGHVLVIYHAVDPNRIDAEVAVPVSAHVDLDVLARAGLAVRVVPAATVAQTHHVGPYEGLPEAYRALAGWLSEHGVATVGPTRERYQVGFGDGVPESAFLTQIEWPIAEARVPVH
jgi:effector-binding domain-containing protein